MCPKACSKISLALFAFLLVFKICHAQGLFFFQGEVNVEGINVRSDSTVNSEIIYTANKGERLEVISELYEWYKIRLPKAAPSYIKKSMVDCIQADTNKDCLSIIALKDRINIRLHPNESSWILGRVNKAEVMTVLRSTGEWYKIVPIKNSFGWIHKKFVNKSTFVKKTNDAKLPENIAGEEAKEDNITLEGIIKPHWSFFKQRATHKLITPDKQIFLLQGNKENLNKINYQKVRVKGEKIDSPGQKYPLIEIITVEVIN